MFDSLPTDFNVRTPDPIQVEISASQGLLVILGLALVVAAGYVKRR